MAKMEKINKVEMTPIEPETGKGRKKKSNFTEFNNSVITLMKIITNKMGMK